jgi:hypothetical protein
VNNRPLTLLSQFIFYTDMTRRGGAEIPLGLVLEVVWPAKGRWMGLVGRTEITKNEMRLVHAPSLPELTKPWTFVLSGFEEAWRMPAGKSGEYLAKKYSHALHVSPPVIQKAFFPTSYSAETDWSEIVGYLTKRLKELGKTIEPEVNDTVVALGRNRKSVQRAEELVDQAA